MTKLSATLALIAGTVLFAPNVAQAAPDVVVSIKPIHSLVASIMEGVAEPGLILKGAGSPHTYQMKPSDADALQNATLIFWVGPEFERFMEKPMESLGDKAKVIELEKAAGLTLLPTRESGTFEPHADEEEHAGGEDHEEHDLHIWLSTANAKAMAAEIASSLAAADPANAAAYHQNLAKLDTKLDALAAEIKTTVAPVKDKPFIVFHDAYQYFEKEFGVNVAGSITVTPENMPGAARIAEIHEKLKTLGASCVFAEPQFEPKLIDVVLEGTQSKTGTLDPEAATLAEGPELYFNLMRGLAGSLKDCLSAG
ncbi:zinc ABC transporter substrate-binding protein [Rhizobium sp. TH2]|uniref:zinc ABC transporter substrate-binding protein n=1 Tax=Rhizobium sp. TH2 TaxID=2775403 RepID=UPI0021586273|nr:zinc ABC transporter substrate-binding protein [Rhizobium sp. TH2]UVC11540.1 zinc ABC transporter substrate-binding protein [Rhizobium sp. TH2]